MIAFETIGRPAVIVYACGNKMLLNFKFVGLDDVLLFLTDRVISGRLLNFYSVWFLFQFFHSSKQNMLKYYNLICLISII